MKTQYTADKVRYRTMDNQELRDSFVLSSQFKSGEITLTYSEIERGIVGSIVPLKQPLVLEAPPELVSNYFTERREVGVINIGGEGNITLDGITYDMKNLDSLYIGMGTKQIEFSSKSQVTPAEFYLASYPAHRTFPNVHVPQNKAKIIDLGGKEKANVRTIFQSIRPGIVESCQLVMGFTRLSEGSVWNTFPPHTHQRRSEYYMYFDLDDNSRVFHFMGEKDNLRSMVLKNKEIALSPMWSMHCGVGTSSYSFIWSMGGENQEFDDMDHCEITDLK